MKGNKERQGSAARRIRSVLCSENQHSAVFRVTQCSQYTGQARCTGAHFLQYSKSKRSFNSKKCARAYFVLSFELALYCCKNKCTMTHTVFFSSFHFRVRVFLQKYFAGGPPPPIFQIMGNLLWINKKPLVASFVCPVLVLPCAVSKSVSGQILPHWYLYICCMCFYVRRQEVVCLTNRNNQTSITLNYNLNKEIQQILK